LLKTNKASLGIGKNEAEIGLKTGEVIEETAGIRRQTGDVIENRDRAKRLNTVEVASSQRRPDWTAAHSPRLLTSEGHLC
jgi:hypothetical protein